MHPSACHLDENWLKYKIIIMTSQYSGNWYLFCHCIYLCIPSEQHFFSDFDAPKYMLFGSKLSGIWTILSFYMVLRADQDEAEPMREWGYLTNENETYPWDRYISQSYQLINARKQHKPSDFPFTKQQPNLNVIGISSACCHVVNTYENRSRPYSDDESRFVNLLDLDMCEKEGLVEVVGSWRAEVRSKRGNVQEGVAMIIHLWLDSCSERRIQTRSHSCQQWHTYLNNMHW